MATETQSSSESATRFNNALAARIAAAKKLVQDGAVPPSSSASSATPSASATASLNAAAAAAAASGSSSASASSSASSLPAYVPRAQQSAVASAPMYPVMAKVVPIAIGLVVGLGIGALTTWFHPAQSRMVSLAGAPFILYFCFMTSNNSSLNSTSSTRMTKAQLIGLLNDPTVSPNAKNKALADEYSAVAEQYVKYGLAMGFILSIIYQMIDMEEVSVWWSKHGEAMWSAVTRTFTGASAIQFFILASGIVFVLFRRRDQSQQYLNAKFTAAAEASAAATAAVSSKKNANAAVADRDATAGTNLADTVSSSGSSAGQAGTPKAAQQQRRKGGGRRNK